VPDSQLRRRLSARLVPDSTRLTLVKMFRSAAGKTARHPQKGDVPTKTPAANTMDIARCMTEITQPAAYQSWHNRRAASPQHLRGARMACPAIALDRRRPLFVSDAACGHMRTSRFGPARSHRFSLWIPMERRAEKRGDPYRVIDRCRKKKSSSPPISLSPADRRYFVVRSGSWKLNGCPSLPHERRSHTISG
jgi:hypothetical protein